MDGRRRNTFTRRGIWKTTAQGCAAFYARIRPGQYIECLINHGTDCDAVEGMCVHTPGATIWWVPAERGELRRSHRHRCIPIPSPEEIRSRAADIRKEWSSAEHARRGRLVPAAAAGLGRLRQAALQSQTRSDAAAYLQRKIEATQDTKRAIDYFFSRN